MNLPLAKVKFILLFIECWSNWRNLLVKRIAALSVLTVIYLIERGWFVKFYLFSYELRR